MKNRFLKVGSLALIILCAFLAIKTINAAKEMRYIGGGVPSSNTISVSGDGEVFAVPDIATISFTIRKDAKTAAEAQAAAAAIETKALDFLKGQGIDEKDIKTTDYNSYPQYDYNQGSSCINGYCPPKGTPQIVGYQLSETIAVKVRNTDQAGAILDGLTTAGVNEVSGPQYEIDDQDALKAEARKQAILKAKDKAKELADDLDVHLVRIVSFSEDGNYPIYYSSRPESVSMDMAAQKAPSLPEGQNRITSNVTITYEIR